ncbi:ABC transporter permease [Acidianus sp. RZ1]|uniref:ABC transporter permease n=1 Tax=Acidianus sp. RZ1 TaxID=1540082 RepID=UPI0014919E45|nr:ABC transporter permease [Acidianus sp. RZ1]NON61321.1 ABC transporter permease [Acidianus sp. RZ1]
MRIKFILALAWMYGYTGIKRAPIYILSYLSLPLSLLLFIFLISRGEFVKFGVLGGLISIVVSNSLSIIGDFAFMRLQLRFQDLLVATEIGPLDYITGLTLGNLINSIPGIVVYAILSWIFNIFTPLTAIISIGILILLLISSSSLAITLASFVKHTRHSWGISTIVSLLFTILPPLYYPYSLLLSCALDILYISPSTAGSVLMQGITGLQSLPLSPILIFLVETAILSLLPFYAMKWRES